MGTALGVAVILLGAWLLFGVWSIVHAGLIAKRLGRETTPFSRHLGGDAKRILVIGDSTAYGTGAGSPDESLAGLLGRAHPSWSVVNAAENAMKLSRLRDKLSHIKEPYDLVFIHIGGMDTIHFTPLPTVRTLLMEVVERAKELAPGSVVVVSVNNAGAVPAFRFPFSSLLSWRSRKVSETFHDVCLAHGVVHAPLWSPKGEDPLLDSRRWFFASDGMHPNGAGYHLWHTRIRKAYRIPS